MEGNLEDPEAVIAPCSTEVADPNVISLLRASLQCQSKECVMETLGISSNTWTKLKRGQPVRRGVIERAITRANRGR
jgi:hypothetical protein